MDNRLSSFVFRLPNAVDLRVKSMTAMESMPRLSGTGRQKPFAVADCYDRLNSSCFADLGFVSNKRFFVEQQASRRFFT